jgi:sulfoxide reductase heme-binding subunit YedZ
MAWQPKQPQVAWIKAAVFAACLAPAVRLGWLFWQDGLGANPIEYVTRATGWWALTLLLVTLTVTPARRALGMPWLLRLRRMLGLFAFCYATLHFTTYVWLDQFFDWGEMVKDVLNRPFITVGFGAFVLLIPLAATSTNAMVRRLGARRWQRLHRAVYAIAALGVTHYWWLVKKDVTEPAVFAGIAALLLAARVAFALRQRVVREGSTHPRPAAATAPPRHAAARGRGGA